MNIIIIGCGKVGETLAEQLNEKGNNITVVDSDPKRVSDITDRLDVMGVVGNGATHTVQEDAGVEKADLLIAVTGSDELNLLCCTVAKIVGNCQTIARIRNPEYSSEAPYLRDKLGLAMVINPEAAAAAEIERVLRFPSALKIDTFARGRVQLIRFRLSEDARIVGMSVREMATKLDANVLVCTVERGEEAHIVKGDFVFAERDVVSIIATPANASDFFKKINRETHPVKDVMIVGGGDLAQYLCRSLARSGISIKLIDRDPARCDELCSQLSEPSIICGDGSDRSLLLEEGIRKADAFAALTGQDEENVLLSLFAKTAGCAKVVTKIDRPDLDDIIRHLDLDSTIYPKRITADIITRYVRAMKNSEGSNMETLYNVIPGKVEAAEFTVRAGSPVLGIPLMKMSIKKNVLVAAIIRNHVVLIPRGADVIMEGDRVVIVSGHMDLDDISDILA